VTLTARVGNAAQATVRRVANHTAGLPLHYSYWHADELAGRPSIEETIRRYGNLITAPGERWLYSNLGYAMLADVIERASGKGFAEFMRTEVFVPLGLMSTSVNIGPRLEPQQAVRYRADGRPWPFYISDHPGGGGISSTAHDLVRFGMFHLKNHLPNQRAVLSDRAIDAMHQSSVATGRTDHYAGYGFGWGTGVTTRGYRTVSHSGTMGGVSTYLDLVPSENVAVVVLGNGDNNLPALIRREILIAMGYEGREMPAIPRPTPESFQPPVELIGDWSGTVHTYRGEIRVLLSIEPTGTAHAKLGDQPETRVLDLRFQDGFLRGRLAGDLSTEDANRRSYDLRLDLKLRGRVLNGGLVAMSPWPGSDRLGNALTHWVELRKQ
jgi:CubicO group peptidase (beta-lactamase class C family)